MVCNERTSCEGFWPFDEGDWKVELEEVVPDYESNPEDAGVIHLF